MHHKPTAILVGAPEHWCCAALRCFSRTATTGAMCLLDFVRLAIAVFATFGTGDVGADFFSTRFV